MPPSVSRTHWQAFRVLYIAVAFAILLALFFFPSAEKGVSRPLLAIAKPAPGSSLVATLESNTLNGSREESITLEATADPATSIDNMEVCAFAPEFTVEPGCVPVRVYSKGDLVLPHAPATIRLIPRLSSGTFKVLLTASWVRCVPRSQPDAPGKGRTGSSASAPKQRLESCVRLAEKVVMPLGPVNLGVDRLTRFGGRFARFIKDLTLPIILIVLANWLTSESAKRDEDRKKHDREQEEENQIAHILLPMVMRLAVQYYLPLTLNSATFVEPLSPGRGTPQELSFSLFSFFLVARSLKEQEGGVFFKDRAAEQMFAVVNNVIRELVVEAVGSETHFTECLDHLGSWVPGGEKRWPRIAERHPAVQQGWTNLENWLVKLEEDRFQAMRYLFNILAETMRYESNAPFADWYTNSRAANLFKISGAITAPANDVFGPKSAGMLEKFQNLLASYRQGKE